MGLINSLSFLDRYLAIWILLFMILGVIIGNYSNVQQAFELITFNSVSLRKSFIPLLISVDPVADLK